MGKLRDLLKGKQPGPPKYPPTDGQLEACKRLGVAVEPWMSTFDVRNRLTDALKDPAKRAIQDEYEKQRAAEQEREDRAAYGDAIIDELKRWEAMPPSARYLAVVRRGKSVLADVVEIGSVIVAGGTKPQVEVELIFPKVHPESDTHGPAWIEWSRVVTVKAPQVLHIEQLDADADDLAAYSEAKARAVAMAAGLGGQGLQ